LPENVILSHPGRLGRNSREDESVKKPLTNANH
jgi:hypothetical protein